jgi:hypothetical protein
MDEMEKSIWLVLAMLLLIHLTPLPEKERGEGILLECLRAESVR